MSEGRGQPRNKRGKHSGLVGCGSPGSSPRWPWYHSPLAAIDLARPNVVRRGRLGLRVLKVRVVGMNHARFDPLNADEGDTTP